MISCAAAAATTIVFSHDAAAIADSLKRRLAAQGKSSDALAFADLYTKLASKTGPGSVSNRRSLLHLLKTVSEDRKFSINFLLLLPNLRLGSNAKKKDMNNGALLITKDSEYLRDIAFREYKNLVKEENEVAEEVLVRDVLYACQCIDGKYVKFHSETDGYAVLDYVKVPRATKAMVRTISELGWLFKKVKTFLVPESLLETDGQAL